MKVSEQWLRKWINPSLTNQQIAETLTMAGLEVEEVTPEGVFDISITPNRGDCLSVIGLARELAALTLAKLQIPKIEKINPTLSDVLTVKVNVPDECPRYAGRVIRNIRTDKATPVWMQDYLRMSGLKCISPAVDVMNYVMLELGQPMHAFDLAKISGEIIVRKATAGEELALLDGTSAKLTPETMVIADQKKPVAIAGVMGGLDSGVSLLTKDLFLESAYFNPEAIARVSRAYNLNSDSSYRFERGIDPTIQVQALERATQLLLEIVGGEAGPIVEVTQQAALPNPADIHLSKEKVDKLLGIQLSENEIETILKRLDFQVTKMGLGWQVIVPARRSDISLDVDLIEEIARLYGYDKLPQHVSASQLKLNDSSAKVIQLPTLRHKLCDLGYHEVVTYSFVDPKHQQLFSPGVRPKQLLNPITSEMAVMRTSLWPGLVNTLLYNQNRQQSRARLFETGLRFLQHDENLIQDMVLSGLINGNAFPEQWGMPARSVDFFDVKGDLQNLFKLLNSEQTFTFKASIHPALHPGQTAAIFQGEQLIGMVGALHPSITQTLGIVGKTYLFELLMAPLLRAVLPKAVAISKFPEIRRDIAILVDKTIPSQAIQDTIIDVAGEFLKDVNLFDVYEGKGIASDRKSIALALTLQHASRTLVDEEVADTMERVITALKNTFAAELRG